MVSIEAGESFKIVLDVSDSTADLEKFASVKRCNGQWRYCRKILSWIRRAMKQFELDYEPANNYMDGMRVRKTPIKMERA